MPSAQGSQERPELSELKSRYVAAQLRGDRREAVRLIMQEGMEQGLTPAELREGVVRKAQLEIGLLWQQNRIGVAQEHMATAISEVVLTHLYDKTPFAKTWGKSIVVACVDGELHDFPARLVADALDTSGVLVRYLGASVPVESIMRELERERPDLLALSVTMSFNLPSLERTLELVRARLPTLAIAVGGAACAEDELRGRGIQADVTAESAPDFLARVRRYFGVEHGE